MKSKSIENASAPCGIGEVVSPRAVTYRGTCQEWFVHGDWTSRTLPTTCVHRCSVAQVSRQSSKGSGGHTSSCMGPIEYSLASGPTRARALTNKRLSGYQPTPMLVHLGTIQERVADLVPDREAVVWGDRVLTHAGPHRAQPAGRERAVRPRPRLPHRPSGSSSPGNPGRITWRSTSTTVRSGSRPCTVR